MTKEYTPKEHFKVEFATLTKHITPGKQLIYAGIKELNEKNYGVTGSFPYGYKVVFAVRGRERVGFITYKVNREFDGIDLYIAYVKPKYRNQGYFNLMMEAMDRTARCEGCDSISWEVVSHNTNMHKVSQTLATSTSTTYHRYVPPHSIWDNFDWKNAS